MMTASQFNPPQTVRNRYMSLETEIKNLAAAVVALTAKIEGINVAPAAPVAQAPTPVALVNPAPYVPMDAPVVTPAPVAMPAAPSFVAPAPVAAPAAGAPFNDPKSLLEYVMGAYKALGADKGQQIQGVLTQLGYQNINDVKPEHYAQLHAGVEALKG
jgi:hypothetical protein